jgi:hypothetical protein
MTQGLMVAAVVMMAIVYLISKIARNSASGDTPCGKCGKVQ